MGGLRDNGARRTGEALLSTDEVAEYFGVTTTTVYRWCREGRIPCMKVGKHWRVRREELVDSLEKAEDTQQTRRLAE